MTGRFDTGGVIEKIIALRGHVHHYNAKSSLKQATPLNHHHYKPWATLMLYVALMCIEAEKARIDQSNV